MKIFKVVLTGGPHSGKTTVLEKLKNRYSMQEGISLITVPETASELIKNGIEPKNFPNIYDFQNLLFKRQYVKERTAEFGASVLSKSNTIIIIYDRGLLDNKAYLDSQADFDRILDENSCKELEILDKYDLVINLKSTAGSDYGYELGIGEARFESEDDVIPLDARTTEAWLGHKNLKIIKPTETIEEKLDIVFDLIDTLVKSSCKMVVEVNKLPLGNFDIGSFHDGKSKLISVLEHELDFELASGFKYFVFERKYKNCISYILEISRQIENIKEVECIKPIDEETAIHFINTLGIKNIHEKQELYFYNDDELCRVDIDGSSVSLVKENDLSLYPASMQSERKILKKFCK